MKYHPLTAADGSISASAKSILQSSFDWGIKALKGAAWAIKSEEPEAITLNLAAKNI